MSRAGTGKLCTGTHAYSPGTYTPQATYSLAWAFKANLRQRGCLLPLWWLASADCPSQDSENHPGDASGDAQVFDSPDPPKAKASPSAHYRMRKETWNGMKVRRIGQTK